ncbi:MAG: GIY-YIG nuclease family protein [Clostridia bacterium]|nr:GIY-YIG nuclease family protein [Clostridia bacterium]
MYYTYIIKCEKGTLYTGIAKDVAKRFSEHTSGNKKGAKYTRANRAVSIQAVWSSADRSTASRLEVFIKKLTRAQKLELISKPSLLKEEHGDKISWSDYQFEKVDI